MTEVSIVMGAKGRPQSCRRTLKSYTNLSYKDYELIFVDVTYGNRQENNLKNVVDEFSGVLPIRYYSLMEDFDNFKEGVTAWSPATTWNYGMKQAIGNFIITCSNDIMLPHKNTIEKMLNQYNDIRLSALTLQISTSNLHRLDAIDWLGNLDVVQSFAGFWDTEWVGMKNKERSSASINTYFTGQSRDAWNWFGGFRNDRSHLVDDQDIVVREICLGKEAETLRDCVVYHQEHESRTDIQRVASPGWHYITEAQARLLEPAERDLA